MSLDLSDEVAAALERLLRDTIDARRAAARDLIEPLCPRRIGATRPATASASPRSWSTRSAEHISGPTASTARSKTFSNFRTKVAASVAGVIEPTLQAAETARSAGRPMSKISGLGSDFIRHPPPAEPMVRRLAAGGGSLERTRL